MLAPSLAILRRSAANSSRIVGAARHLTGGAANISVDHYSSGWKIDDIADFTKEGKFHIKTYNKISEQVGFLLSMREKRKLNLVAHRET